MKIFLKTIILTLLLLLSACSDSKNDDVISSFSNDLNSTTLVVNRTLQVNVFAHYNNGEQKDITDTLIWNSSDESLATVENGHISAKNELGDVSISYKTQELLSSGENVNQESFVLSIHNTLLKTITLSEDSLSLSVGTSSSVQAMGTFEDGSVVDISDDCIWSSSNSEISSAENGLVSGISEGSATITASDSNISSNILSVEVSKSYYESLEITSETTEFNVEQTLELKAIATTSSDEEVELNPDELIWTSSDESVISIDEESAVATALLKGGATITARLKSDESIDNSLALTVKKDKYMRLFRDGVEIAFPNTEIHEYEVFPEDFSTFSMIAVGDNFSVSELSVTNFDGSLTIHGWFDNLNNFDTIVEDENRTFKLMHNDLSDNLHYYFRINDEFNNEFSEKYKEDN